MIWALLIAYFLSGGGVSGSMLTPESVNQLSKRTETVVADPARAEATQQLLAQLYKEVKAFDKKFADSGSQLKKSYKDHTADTDQAMAILEDLNRGWEASQQRGIDLRFELRNSLTREEWAALFPVQ